MLAIETARALANTVSAAMSSYGVAALVGAAVVAALSAGIYLLTKPKKSGDLTKEAGGELKSSPTVGSFFRDKGTDYIPSERDDVVFGEGIIDKINKPPILLSQKTPEFNIPTLSQKTGVSPLEHTTVDFNTDFVKDFQLGKVATSFGSFIENSKQQMEEFKSIFKEKQKITLEATINNPVDSYSSKYVHYKHGDESSFATNVTDFA